MMRKPVKEKAIEDFVTGGNPATELIVKSTNPVGRPVGRPPSPIEEVLLQIKLPKDVHHILNAHAFTSKQPMRRYILEALLEKMRSDNLL